MKRIITLFAAMALVATVATAQDDAAAGATWTTSTTPALKVSEQLFNNWSKSGNSTFDVTSTFFGNYKYTHPKYVWDNVADLAYGYAWQDLDPEGVLFETRRKSNDKIDLTSALSWNAYKGWGASFTANLKTQFGRGYEYEGVGQAAEDSKMLVSDFFAPAYLTTALAFEYKKPDWSYVPGDGGARTKYTGIEAVDKAGFERLKGMNWLQRRAFETDLDMEVKLDYRFSSHIAANFALNLKYDTDFAGMGRGGHWQLYQLAGVQLFFNWKTPQQ